MRTGAQGTLGLFVAAIAAVGCGQPAPVDLLCEYRAAPRGLGVRNPRFSWRIDDPSRGAAQTAYRILVASDRDTLAAGAGDLWDSKRVTSDRSVHVPYGGKALTSRRRAWWKVRTWDAAGKPLPWSKPASFEMGLLERSDWKAAWIEPSEMQVLNRPIKLSRWYWHPAGPKDGQTVFFRAVIEYPDAPKPHHGQLAVAADDRCEVFVNGHRAGAGGGFKKAPWYTLWGGSRLRPGRNVIAVKVKNATGPAGLALGVRQTWFGGRQQEVVPSRVTCSTKSAAHWNKPTFAEKGWVAARAVAQQGDAPWGEVTQDYDGPRRSAMLRKCFDLPAAVAGARAYVTGLGFYELRINGNKVGDAVFTPGWTRYARRVQYQVYDVTEMLAKGSNAVGAILGNGWWSGGLGWEGAERHAEKGQNLRLLLQLEIRCTDGSAHTVATGPGWQWHFSPILSDTIYHGEKYDARLEQPGWDTAAFTPDGWKDAAVIEDFDIALDAQREPFLRVTGELAAKKITEIADGVYILDFGQNHSGRPRLTVEAPAGTTVEMVHAETLKDDGTLLRANYRSARVTDRYTCRGGGVETWEPRFTYRGFRYLRMTGLPSPPGKNTVVSRVLHNDVPFAGAFSCANPLLNRILESVKWGQVSNLHSVPTDCPQRDERLGWMGDAQAFGPTSIWNMDMARFYTKWMRDILDSQLADGSVPGVCPVVGQWEIGPGRSAWADAITIIPWQIYLYYGDRRILADTYAGNVKWVEFIRSKLNADGLYEQPTWGDWVPVVKTPDKPVAAMYGYRSADLLSRTAAILGRKDDAKKYAEMAAAQRAAFNNKHLDPKKNSYVTGTQTANLLPLAFGMVDPDRRQAVADTVARDVTARGGHHSTGFLGTPVILPILSRYGYADLAYGIVNTTEYPSLGYMLEKGATTIWERWNTDTMGPEMNSRNHFAFGSMAQWFYEGLAGLNPDPSRPGFKHAVVRPRPVGDLAWVKASYPTLYGELAVHWRFEGSRWVMDLTVPANTTATVRLPLFGIENPRVTESGRPVDAITIEGDRAVTDVAAGRYRFAVHGLSKK